MTTDSYDEFIAKTKAIVNNFTRPLAKQVGARNQIYEEEYEGGLYGGVDAEVMPTHFWNVYLYTDASPVVSTYLAGLLVGPGQAKHKLSELPRIEQYEKGGAVRIRFASSEDLRLCLNAINRDRELVINPLETAKGR